MEIIFTEYDHFLGMKKKKKKIRNKEQVATFSLTSQKSSVLKIEWP